MERVSKFLNLSQLTAICVVLSLSAMLPAAASVEHQVSFSVEGMVIVWGETHETSDISITPNFAARDAIVQPVNYDASVVTTGNLLRPIAQGPTLGVVGAPSTTSSEHSFYVASNTAFNIRSDVSAVAEEMLDDVAVRITVGSEGQIGRAAQLPHVEGGTGGVNTNIRTLRDMQAEPLIYTGTRRTAAISGSIVDQSVRFGVSYDTVGSAAERDFSSRDVTYTIYIP